ncbi:MAG: FAD-dependent oxidoreductase, partial [Chloroflexi bacterium]
MNLDAIVVGAGPAGSTAARGIAERGGRVLLLDRAKFPRDKPCGGGVTVRCAELLPFSIEPIVEDVVTHARLRVRDGRDIERDAGGVITYMTQRRRLDAFLVERAQERGVEFRDGQTVTDVSRHGDGTYEVGTKDERHTARV